MDFISKKIYIYQNKKFIGSVSFVLNLKKCVCTILNLFIEENFRNLGYGTRLVNRVINYTKKCKNIKCIELDDMTTINGKNNIYYKCGFRYVNQKHGPEMIYKIK